MINDVIKFVQLIATLFTQGLLLFSVNVFVVVCWCVGAAMHSSFIFSLLVVFFISFAHSS